jgi:hypothetical protein
MSDRVLILVKSIFQRRSQVSFRFKHLRADCVANTVVLQCKNNQPGRKIFPLVAQKRSPLFGHNEEIATLLYSQRNLRSSACTLTI